MRDEEGCGVRRRKAGKSERSRPPSSPLARRPWQSIGAQARASVTPVSGEWGCGDGETRGCLASLAGSSGGIRALGLCRRDCSVMECACACRTRAPLVRWWRFPGGFAGKGAPLCCVWGFFPGVVVVCMADRSTRAPIQPAQTPGGASCARTLPRRRSRGRKDKIPTGEFCCGGPWSKDGGLARVLERIPMRRGSCAKRPWAHAGEPRKRGIEVLLLRFPFTPMGN